MRLVEKYRPTRWEDVVGQEDIVASIKAMCQRGVQNFPHLLFTGKPGTGKTTIAQLIAREFWKDDWRNHYLELNASDERGIDTVRNVIKSVSQTKGERILLLDEADMMTFEAQQSLRRIVETTNSTIFIFTANFPWRIIEAIRSRTTCFNFKPIPKEKILLRICQILKSEGIVPQTEEEKRALVKLAELSGGDLRWAINTLESMLGNDGRLNTQVVDLITPSSNEVRDCLEVAHKGNLQQGIEMMRLLLQKYKPDDILQIAYDWLDGVQDLEVRARLYTKLSDIDDRIKKGGNPVIHLSALLSWIWIAPHLKKISTSG